MKTYSFTLVLYIMNIHSVSGLGEGVVDLNAVLGVFNGVANIFGNVSTIDTQVSRLLGKWHQMYKAAINFDVNQSNMYCEVAYFTRNPVMGPEGLSMEEAFHINSKNGPIKTFKRDLQKIAPGEYWMYTEEYFYPRQFYILKTGPQKYSEDIDTDDTYLIVEDVEDGNVTESERNYTKNETNVSKSERNYTKNERENYSKSERNHSKSDNNITKNELYGDKSESYKNGTKRERHQNGTRNDRDRYQNGTKIDRNENGTSDGRYEYLIATDSNRLALVVYARDPEEFHKLYEKEVQTFLNKQGFGGYVFWNQPVAIYQNSDCYYPSEKELFVRRSLKNGQYVEPSSNSNSQLQPQGLQPFQQQGLQFLQPQGLQQLQQVPNGIPQLQQLNSLAAFFSKPQQFPVPITSSNTLQQPVPAATSFLPRLQQPQLPSLAAFFNQPQQQFPAPVVSNSLQLPAPPVLQQPPPLVQQPLPAAQQPPPVVPLVPAQPVLPIVQQQPPPPPPEPPLVQGAQRSSSSSEGVQGSPPLIAHSFQLRLPNLNLNPFQQGNSFLQVPKEPFIKSYQELPDLFSLIGKAAKT